MQFTLSHFCLCIIIEMPSTNSSSSKCLFLRDVLINEVKAQGHCDLLFVHLLEEEISQGSGQMSAWLD